MDSVICTANSSGNRTVLKYKPVWKPSERCGEQVNKDTEEKQKDF